jgi:exodeoxyribonuclease III
MDKFIDSGYVDTFRMFNTEPENYSWWSYRTNAREKNVGWRIDYFCVNKGFRKKVKSADILKKVMGSDHCPVQVVLK